VSEYTEEFVAEGVPREFTGLYPLATCFYTAYSVAGNDAFPVPQELSPEQQTRYTEASERVCEAIRTSQPINGHDKGDDAVILLLGTQPDSRDFHLALEAAGIRNQLAALYDECPTATSLVA